MMPDLLLELLSEEIPARFQKRAAEDLRKSVTDALVEGGLVYEGAKEFWTPRRLALDVRGLSARSSDISEQKKGPRTDAPEKAIEGFLRGAELSSINQAQIKSDPKKGDYYVAVIEKPGRKAKDIIAEVMPGIIANFPWPKSMRWGEASARKGSLKWVRPLQSVICLFGPETESADIVQFEIGGIKSGNTTSGHRFMAPDTFTVTSVDDYQAKLEKAFVMLDPQRRMEVIKTEAENLAFAQGLELVEDDNLLAEVSGLVEWPIVLMGEFDPGYLDIPPEVIQLTIRENQKCFVLRKKQKLTNKFLLVSNIVASDGGGEVTRGNGRVINARLADAKFFWDNDLAQVTSKDGFKPWLEKLDNVTFHAKLGSQGERVKRIVALSEELAPIVGADIKKAKRAAELCKADLNSAMVYEFPELQGLMGRYYAERVGEDASVASAIEAHYKPQGPSDHVPDDPVAIAVALADKLDTLVGFWAIDEKPTGSKDPFALRRAALGVIRLVLENEICLNLNTFFDQSLDLLAFFHDRLKTYLRDKGIRHDLIDAVLTPDGDDLLVIEQKASALQELIDTRAGENLLAGTKRAANILAAEEKKGTTISTQVSDKLLSVDSELELNKVLNQIESKVSQALEKEDYSSAMRELAKLREPVDSFFEHVHVNDEDEKIRANRLALLGRIRAVTTSVADFSKISG